MEVKVAIRGGSSFHHKSSIVADADGNRRAFVGSLNETGSGWRQNWESVWTWNRAARPGGMEISPRFVVPPTRPIPAISC